VLSRYLAAVSYFYFSTVHTQTRTHTRMAAAAVTSTKKTAASTCTHERRAEAMAGHADLSLAVNDDTLDAFGARTHPARKCNHKVTLPPLPSTGTAVPPARARDSDDDEDQLSVCGTTRRQSQHRVSDREKPPLLADLVQNTAEYASANIADLMSLRGVSHEFENAVSDAMGFLNDRCWTAFEARDATLGATSLLWASRGSEEIIATNRCALVCLRHRLETLRWDVDRSRTRGAGHLPLELFGDVNTVLTVLDVGGRCIDADKLRNLRGLKSLSAWFLQGATCFGDLPALESLTLLGARSNLCILLRDCVALRELSLEASKVHTTLFTGLGDVLSRLVKLNLSRCTGFTSVSSLVVCTSLRELNLSRSSVNDLRGLERLPALEVLDLRGVMASGSYLLAQCERLRTLYADVRLYAPVEVQVRCATETHLARSRGAVPRCSENVS
jgi:hypothetical protein